jgi:hypothetical protein
MDPYGRRWTPRQDTQENPDPLIRTKLAQNKNLFEAESFETFKSEMGTFLSPDKIFAIFRIRVLLVVLPGSPRMECSRVRRAYLRFESRTESDQKLFFDGIGRAEAFRYRCQISVRACSLLVLAKKFREGCPNTYTRTYGSSIIGTTEKSESH